MRLIECRRPHYRGQQVCGERSTQYHVGPDGLLYRMTGKLVADSPGVEDADAVHFLEGDPSTFREVAAADPVVPPEPRPRAPVPPPPPRPAAGRPKASEPPAAPLAPPAAPPGPPVIPEAPKGLPWGAAEGDLMKDPETYVSRLPPEDQGHNALTVAKWLELADLVGIPLSTDEAKAVKADIAATIRTRAVEWDRLRTT